MAVSVPITALFIFTFNFLLIQLGASDISGAGIAVITQIGPLNTVLVIAGAVSTAI
jgi:phospholipid/cholesterol/gamma-HCH transport system permease protein